MATKTLKIIAGITGDIELTPAQAAADIISLQGSPGIPFVVTVPDGVQEWLFNNQTGDDALIQTESGTSAKVMSKRNQRVWIDSANNANNET